MSSRNGSRNLRGPLTTFPPTYPSYQMAQSLLGLKLAYEKAAKAGAKPNPDQIAASFKGIEFTVRPPREAGDRRQATRHHRDGLRHLPFNKQRKSREIVDVMRFRPNA